MGLYIVTAANGTVRLGNQMKYSHTCVSVMVPAGTDIYRQEVFAHQQFKLQTSAELFTYT